MSLRDLNTATRRRLRWHGWLLTLWCVAVGFATSAFLLRVLHVEQPAVRYAMVAVVMYAVGLVAGTRFWLRHFAASVRAEADLGRADALERQAHDRESAKPSLVRR